MALLPLLQTIYSFYKSSTLQLVRSELAALAVPAASPASSSTFTNKICFRNGTHNGIGYVSYQSGTHTDGICFRSWTQRTLTGRICSHSVTLTGRKLFLGGTFTGRICSRSVTLTGRICSRSVRLPKGCCLRRTAMPFSRQPARVAQWSNIKRKPILYGFHKYLFIAVACLSPAQSL